MRYFLFIFCLSFFVCLSFNSIHARLPSATSDINTGIKTIDNGIDVDITPMLEAIDQQAQHRTSQDQLKGQMDATLAAQKARQNAKLETASQTQNTLRDQQNHAVATVAKRSATAQKLCSAAVGSGDTAGIYETRENIRKGLNVAASRLFAGAEGEISQNGSTDFQREMFARANGLCDPASFGGAGENFCTGGTGYEHITIATLIDSYSIVEGTDRHTDIVYMHDLLFARIPESLNPDLLENPDTNIQNLVIDSNRLQAEMTIGSSMFNAIQANRSVDLAKPAQSLPFLKEVYVANKLSPEGIQERFSSGVSWNTYLETLTVGAYGQDYMLQQLGADSEMALLQVIGQQMMLNNMLQFEQYKLLEGIALATSTNIVVNRDDAIKDLNAKIRRANGG